MDDLVARHGGMLLKALTLIGAPLASAMPHRRITQLLNVQEAMLAVYRDVIPIPLWFRFLLRWPSGIYLPGIVRGCYLTIKLTGILDKAYLLRTAIEALVLHQTPYGRYVREEELAAAREEEDNVCTICHDEPSRPIRLRCGHIFCEDCVYEWLQREQTCPLCRCRVRSAVGRYASDGSTSILPVIF